MDILILKASIAKIAGHKVIGASHGNSIGMFDLQLRAFIDLSIVDIFLVVTEQAAAAQLQKFTKVHVWY